MEESWLAMSMTLSADWAKSFDAIAVRVSAAAPAAAEAAAFEVEAEAKRLITGGHAKGTKTGASPGGPPENISGTLRRSIITTHPRLIAPGVGEAGVGPTTVYGRAVDQGHPRWKSGVKYPYIEPAVEFVHHAGLIETAQARIWSRAIHGEG